jgi:hypothetical protein
MKPTKKPTAGGKPSNKPSAPQPNPGPTKGITSGNSGKLIPYINRSKPQIHQNNSLIGFSFMDEFKRELN